MALGSARWHRLCPDGGWPIRGVDREGCQENHASVKPPTKPSMPS